MDRPIPQFSNRERQLIEYAAEGFTDSAIANKLGISEATVGTYWGRVRIKLGPYSRTELVAIVLRAERKAAIEELRQKNEALSRQVSELAHSEGKNLYRNLLHHAPDAILLVSQKGKIDFSNQAADELFGYSPGELNGQDLLNLIPTRFRNNHVRHREDYVSNPERRQMGEHLETPALRKDGTEFAIRAALSAIQTPEGLLITCAIRASKNAPNSD